MVSSTHRHDRATLTPAAAAEGGIPNIIKSSTTLSIHPSVIQPSEEVITKLIISPTRPGMVDLRALGVYASAEDENEISTTPLSTSFVAAPLLDLVASVRPSKSGAGEFLVSLDVVNVSPLSVSVGSIQPVSAYWDGKAHAKRSDLWPNQSLKTVLRVKGSQDTSRVDLDQKDLVEALSKLVQGQQEVSLAREPGRVALRGAPTSSLGGYFQSRRSFRLTQLQDQFPAIPLSTLTSLFPLFPPLDLDILVSWSFEDSPSSGVSRSGTTTLFGTRLTPDFSIVEGIRREVDEAIAKGGKTTRTMYEETGRLRQALVDSILSGPLAGVEDPVHVVVRAGEVEGDGGIVPVHFEIRNASPKMPVRWVLRLNTDDQNE